jgi:four helix bundle protein
MRKSSFKDLQVWEKSIKLCPTIYNLASTLPDSEKFGLFQQIRRAVTSIPVNIAEGHGRSSDPDFIRFLYISLGSLQEVETLIIIGQQLEYFGECAAEIEKIHEIGKMISGLIRKLQDSS